MMDNSLELTEILSLIDVFRFTVKQDEVTSILKQTINQDAHDGPNNSVTNRHQVYDIVCLDLSSKLASKKIVEDNDDKPWDKLQQILFERLMMDDYGSCKQVNLTFSNYNTPFSSPNLAPRSLGNEFKPSDSQIMRYLYGCYYRLQHLKESLQTNASISKEYKDKISSSLLKAETLILEQVFLYLTEPDLFPDREKRVKDNFPVPVLMNVVSYYLAQHDESHNQMIQKFVNSIGEACKTLGDAGYDAIVDPTYVRLTHKFVSMPIDDPSLQDWFSVARVFIQQPEIAQKFLAKNILKTNNSVAYQSTLLGFMLSVSPLPRTSQLGLLFFTNPSRVSETDHRSTEAQIGVRMQLVGVELFTLFKSWLKLPQTRNVFLTWMGKCLYTLRDRNKLWNNQLLMAQTSVSVNDGFSMNFLTVMLHLSEPFVGPYYLDFINSYGRGSHSINKKMLKVHPQYCKWSMSASENSQAHFLGLSEETFLINLEATNQVSPETSAPDQQLNFISDCFYGTHLAFSYAFRSIYERFFKLGQNINELQHAYSQFNLASIMPNMAAPSHNDPREIIREKLDAAMSRYFNLKAVLMIPNRITMQLHFCIATAAYLNHLVACQSFEEAINAEKFRTITSEDLREKKMSKICLQYIPEMLVENILDFFLFLKNFNDQALAQASGILDPLMTTIITFMGNSSLIQNPHLRARFAEILECLMPHQSHHGSSFIGCADLFECHPLIDELAPSLVNVFVSIEMTGEGVQFEQKFSYRRPMYVVLEYLWGMSLHRKNLIELAKSAEANIDSARPPLFLRFINLLMNDAIFLLDEALSYMNQLREAERRKKTEEWQNLNRQQRAQAEASYTQIGRLARFHNVLSLSTIGTLAWLTSEIKTIFCHATLVDRIANMLNYFLEHLVGPKKGKFNVNDKNDYEFKPREVLEKICQIYISLGQVESNPKYNEFCTAISSDGRSYSGNLLPQASAILFRTGMSALGTEFEKLAQLVQKIAIQNQMDEIPIEDIPDTFLDPIMSTLMVDPVLLPSSHIIVDRSTISRHLLSDQTDPFNRSPLTMEDVIPETDLKNQIECFLKDRREALRQRTPKEGQDIN